MLTVSESCDQPRFYKLEKGRIIPNLPAPSTPGCYGKDALRTRVHPYYNPSLNPSAPPSLPHSIHPISLFLHSDSQPSFHTKTTKPWLRGCCHARFAGFPGLIQLLSRMCYGGCTDNSGYCVPSLYSDFLQTGLMCLNVWFIRGVNFLRIVWLSPLAHMCNRFITLCACEWSSSRRSCMCSWAHTCLCICTPRPPLYPGDYG